METFKDSDLWRSMADNDYLHDIWLMNENSHRMIEVLFIFLPLQAYTYEDA